MSAETADAVRPARASRRRSGGSVAMSGRGRRALSLYFVLFLVFLYLPTVILISMSFNPNVLPEFPPSGFTLKWYRAALEKDALVTSIMNSLTVALVVSVVTPLIGLAAGYALARREFPGKNAIMGFLLVPLVVPLLVLGVSLLMLFRQGPAFLQVPLGVNAVMVGHVILALPYCLLLLVPRLASIDKRLEEAAADLGATGLQTFRKIVLPLIRPALLSSVIITFVVSIDEVAVASFLSGDQATYPMFLYQSLKFVDQLPPIIPPATVMIVLSFALSILAEVIRRRGERELGLNQGPAA